MSKRFFSISPRLALAYSAMSLILPALVYLTAQHVLRQTANDPQIQLAEDAAAALNAGQPAAALAAGQTIDMRASLAPFIIITDANRQPLAATGRLDGNIVLPPAQMFDDAKAGRRFNSPAGENRVTWEPAAGVRQAAVIVPYNGGYVLAARNLRETEIRQSQAFGFAAATAALLGVIGLLISSNILKRNPTP